MLLPPALTRPRPPRFIVVALAKTAKTNQQLTAGIDSDRGSGAARADDLDPTAIDGESEQKAAVEREAAAEDLAGTAADKSALGGAAVA